MLMRCNPLAMPMTMAGTAMGGLAMLAAVGPFLAGVGVGAAIVGGSVLARKAMRRRDTWRDDDGMGTDYGSAGMGGATTGLGTPLEPGDDATRPSAPPL
jgi:hypothetical protein